MRLHSRRVARAAASLLVAFGVVGFGGAATVVAQPATGAVSIAGGVDAPAVYIFRGIVQEGDPRLTLTPYANVSLALREDERVRAHIGLWNSFNTGTSGSGGPLRGSHFTERLSASLSIRGPRGIVLTPGYLVNASANGGYEAIHELGLTVALEGRLSPYVLMAFELTGRGQLDEGAKKGRYLELGALPSIDLRVWRLRLNTPVRMGVSLGDYYERFERDLRFRDHRFGFVQAGGHLRLPLSSSSPFSAWSVHGGADVFVFGDSTRSFNRGGKSRIVGTIGVSFTY